MIAVIVPAYGDKHVKLAKQRAIPSVTGQKVLTPIPVLAESGTVAQLRNAGVAWVSENMPETRWVSFLDADDELDPGYGKAMVTAIDAYGYDPDATGSDWVPPVLVPATAYSRGKPRQRPMFWPEQDLRNGNWIPIGCTMPVELFVMVGGFKEWPMYEDWCLWQRCSRVGAHFVKVPAAHYFAHASPGSRNRGPSRAEKEAAHDAIRRANFPELYDAL
jgi:hypothetical protein